MKIEPVTKPDERNKATSKHFDDDVIVTFPIYSQFGVIRKPDSGRIFCKTHIFINSNLLSYKN